MDITTPFDGTNQADLDCCIILVVVLTRVSECLVGFISRTRISVRPGADTAQFLINRPLLHLICERPMEQMFTADWQFNLVGMGYKRKLAPH